MLQQATRKLQVLRKAAEYGFFMWNQVKWSLDILVLQLLPSQWTYMFQDGIEQTVSVGILQQNRDNNKQNGTKFCPGVQINLNSFTTEFLLSKWFWEEKFCSKILRLKHWKCYKAFQVLILLLLNCCISNFHARQNAIYTLCYWFNKWPSITFDQ